MFELRKRTLFLVRTERHTGWRAIRLPTVSSRARRPGRQWIELGELRRPEQPREHAELAEALSTMMDGMQVRAVLMPKHLTARVMWSMIESCLQLLLPKDVAGRAARARPQRDAASNRRAR